MILEDVSRGQYPETKTANHAVIDVKSHSDGANARSLKDRNIVLIGKRSSSVKVSSHLMEAGADKC